MKNHQLILVQLQLNCYNQTEAIAYVYPINSSKKLIDHRGKMLTTFMNHHDMKNFEHYVEHNIIPIMKRGIKNSEFKITGIDYPNNEPHPSMIIKKNDHSMIHDHDLKNLNAQLNNIITNHNKNNSMSNTGLFKHEQKQKPVSEFFERNKNISALRY